MRRFTSAGFSAIYGTGALTDSGNGQYAVSYNGIAPDDFYGTGLNGNFAFDGAGTVFIANGLNAGSSGGPIVTGGGTVITPTVDPLVGPGATVAPTLYARSVLEVTGTSGMVAGAQNRWDLLGGTLEVCSVPGEGTELKINVPLEAAL